MNSFEFDEDLFTKNMDLLAKKDTLTAYQAMLTPFKTVQFCHTSQGELNLKKIDSPDYYCHSRLDAQAEANQLIKLESLDKVRTIYVYGLGLGYIYNALKPWLEKSSSNQLIFMEDDLEVIKAFLYTKQATDILQSDQTFFFRLIDDDSSRLQMLCSKVLDANPRFLTLPSYGIYKEKQAIHLCFTTLSISAYTALMLGEILSGAQGFFNNYYSNILQYLPHSYLGNNLFDKFKGTPAIICGAGPSIEKHLDLLHSLGDKALIFAGGSSLNILSNRGINPHFGAGIDPNPEQMHRLQTNQAFSIPFFYRPRLCHEALEFVDGPLLYLSGVGDNYYLTGWMDGNLGLPTEKIDEGYNVVNLCTSLARHLGCNPIIFVGMDLAFTETKTYASGVSTHPLRVDQQSPYQFEANQESVIVKDIYGTSTRTKWIWIDEAGWLSSYAAKYPETSFINATEGGLGFQGIPNRSLQEVIDHSLTNSMDLLNYTHTMIQQSTIKIERSKIIHLFNSINQELDKCHKLCQFILKELEKYQPNAEKRNLVSSLYTTAAIFAESEFESSWGYSQILKDFDWAHHVLKYPLEINIYESENLQETPSSFYSTYYRFNYLERVVSLNLKLLKESIYSMMNSLSINTQPSSSFIFHPQAGEVYHFQNDHLKIKDPLLALDIEERTDPNLLTVKEYTDPEGKTLNRCFYYKGKLHGPSRFYSNEGKLLAEGWFAKGERQGKNLQFYLSGEIYSIQRFKDNKLHDKQEYFFENQMLHMSLQYQKGLLHGSVLIYSPQGQLMRELNYTNGKRNGMERMWATNGNLIVECQYENGIPTGIARQWSKTGQLEKEANIHHFPNVFDFKSWNSEGQVVSQFKEGVEDFNDYYQNQQSQVNFTEGALQLMVNQLDKVLLNEVFQDKEALNELNASLDKIKEKLGTLKNQQTELSEQIESNLKYADDARKNINQKPSQP